MSPARPRASCTAVISRAMPPKHGSLIGDRIQVIENKVKAIEKLLEDPEDGKSANEIREWVEHAKRKMDDVIFQNGLQVKKHKIEMSTSQYFSKPHIFFCKVDQEPELSCISEGKRTRASAGTV